MTFMNMMNRIHYIGASYAIGTILMGITNHIHNSLSITGIGCVLDMLHLIFRSSNSKWVSVRYCQFIMHFLAIMYELVYMTMLHCYWQYTEATKNQPQSIVPIKLGQNSAEELNPSVTMSPPIQSTEPVMDSIAHEPNAAASKSIVETPEPNAETESSTAIEKGVVVPKPPLSSTEPSLGAPNSTSEILQPIETTDPDVNATDPDVNATDPDVNAIDSDVNGTEPSDALTNTITPRQEPNPAAIDSAVEKQKSSTSMEPRLESEPDENALEHNVILTEPIESPQEYSVSTPEPKDPKEEKE